MLFGAGLDNFGPLGVGVPPFDISGRHSCSWMLIGVRGGALSSGEQCRLHLFERHR